MSRSVEIFQELVCELHVEKQFSPSPGELVLEGDGDCKPSTTSGENGAKAKEERRDPSLRSRRHVLGDGRLLGRVRSSAPPSADLEAEARSNGGESSGEAVQRGYSRSRHRRRQAAATTRGATAGAFQRENSSLPVARGEFEIR